MAEIEDLDYSIELLFAAVKQIGVERVILALIEISEK